MSKLVYLFFGQRRFYGGSTGTNLLKTVLARVGIYVVAVVIFAGSLVAAILLFR